MLSGIVDLSLGVCRVRAFLSQAMRTFLASLIVLSISSSALAQSKGDKEKARDRKDGPSELELASRVAKAEESLLREYMEVVNEYYKKGEKEAAVQVLQRVASINPKMDGVKERINAITEELLQENGIKSELDVSKGWVPICEVEDGKPFRLTLAGDYKMDLTAAIPLTGLSTADPAKDHVAGAAFGAVIGLVVTEGKPGDPFPVNAGVEHSPKKSGQLWLRVNVPLAARCKGDLKLQVSGAVKPIIKKR